MPPAQPKPETRWQSQAKIEHAQKVSRSRLVTFRWSNPFKQVFIGLRISIDYARDSTVTPMRKLMMLHIPRKQKPIART